ncbi:MAG: DUF1588 domain-containing protein [Verrucomicrobiota bacterium]|nr:DUF1588 domain-containing protein [Verrucomicrobiota bacterium]
MTRSQHRLLTAILLWATPPAAHAAPDAVLVETVRPLLEEYCADCHDDGQHKGGYRVDLLTGDMAREAEDWAAALERLRAGDMPPEGKRRPDAQSIARLAAWIGGELAKFDPASPAAPFAESPAKPGDGNRVPHALLFGTRPTATVPPPPRLWRLSPGGYSEGFVRALRGGGHKGLAQPFSFASEPGIKDFAGLYAIDGAGAEVLLRNAERIVDEQTKHELVEEGERPGVRMRNDTIGDFKPLLDPRRPPAREQLEKAGRTQFRMALMRDASDEEIARLIALYEKNLRVSGHVAAAKTMLMAPLLSPEAMFRFELGRGAEVRPGVRMLAPREIAFAISLAASDQREKGLFEAAAKNGLTTREEVAGHVRRALGDAKFPKPRVLGFFREYFGYDHAAEIFKDKPADVLHSPRTMISDTDQLILHIVEQDKDVLRELLTTPKSFANWAPPREDKKTRQLDYKRAQQAHPVNDKGRKHPEAAYGIEEWTPVQPVTLPNDRIGILMQPSWLVAWSGNFDNDPIRRGRWVREQLLGGRVPDLPIGVAAKVPDEPETILRERLRVTRDEACWKCHSKMDGLGLPFEQFDHYGKFRTVEAVRDLEATQKNVDKKGKPLGPVLRDVALDTSGFISASGEAWFDGPVQNPVELVRRLADSARVRQVFIRHAFRYYLGRNESAGDAKTLQDADRAYIESGGSFKTLLVSLLSSESFLFRTVSPPPSSAQR